MDKIYLLIILDGARFDVFKELYKKGELKFLKTVTSDKGFYKAVSTFPSTTGPAHLPVLTGKSPGECNIPGIRWFDRKIYSSNKFSIKKYRSYVGFGAYLIDYDIDGKVQTIFSFFKNPSGVFSAINRGIRLSQRLGYFSRAYLTPYARLNGNWEDADLTVRDYVKKGIEKDSDFIHALFPSVDELSHHSHPFADKVIEAYIRFDHIMKDLFNFTARVKPFTEIKFCIVSDHGLTKTHTHLDLDQLIENKIHKKTFYYPKTFRAWRNPEIINMISGNGMSHIYIKGKQGWKETLSIDEIIDSGIVDILLEREEIDLVILKKNSKSGIVFSIKGKGEIGLNEKGFFYYRKLEGDPLEAGNNLKDNKNGILLKTHKTNYPDSVYAITQLLYSSRTGDIMVSAKPGYDLRAGHLEIPEHLSTHGSLYKEHMLVPVLTNIEYSSSEVIRTSECFDMILKDAGKYKE